MVSTVAGIGIALGVVAIIIVTTVAVSFTSFVVSNVQDNNMCENWLAALNQKQAEYDNSGFLDKLSFDAETFNADIAEYNQQCAYQ